MPLVTQNPSDDIDRGRCSIRPLKQGKPVERRRRKVTDLKPYEIDGNGSGTTRKGLIVIPNLRYDEIVSLAPALARLFLATVFQQGESYA